MTKVVEVTQYSDEGIAIIEDSAGKFAVTKDSEEFIPIYDSTEVQAWFGYRNRCALVQTRQGMLT